MDPLFDKKYISSKEASELSGYHSDYLARLCRTGVIVGTRVGRSWVLNRDSLQSFVAKQEVQQKKNAKKLAQVRQQEYRSAKQVRDAQAKPVTSKVPAAPIPSDFVFAPVMRQQMVAALTALVVLNVVLVGAYGEMLPTTSRITVENIRQIGTNYVPKLVENPLATIAQTHSSIGETYLEQVEKMQYLYIGVLEEGGESVLAAGISTRDSISTLSEVTTAPLSGWVSLSNTLAYEIFAGLYEIGDVGMYASNATPRTVATAYDQSVSAWTTSVATLADTASVYPLAFGTSIHKTTSSLASAVENEVLGVVGSAALSYDTTRSIAKQTFAKRLNEPRNKVARESVELVAAVAQADVPTATAADKPATSSYALGSRTDADQAAQQISLTGTSSSRGLAQAVPAEAAPTVRIVNSPTSSSSLTLSQDESESELAPEAAITLAAPSALKAAAAAGVSEVMQSAAEDAALYTYTSIRSWFDDAGTALASIFSAPTTNITINFIGSQTVQQVSQAVGGPSTGPVTNVFENYVSVQGVSYDYLEERLAWLRERVSNDIYDSIDNNNSSGGGGGSGSVTSVDASGGTTGLSFTGGPITSTGTLTLSGTLSVANGGTGITTAPTYGELLMGDGLGGYALVATSSLGISAGSGTPGGANTQVQFNNAGVFAGDAGFTYNLTTDVLSVVNGLFTNATTTAFGLNAETFTDLTGTGLTNVGGVLSLNATGDWTGTFDGQEGSYYLANSFSTTSANYWQTTRDFFSTTSATYFLGQNQGLAFSTTSANYWETQQTSRTADDLTNNSIEDLSDVTAMTKNYGDLLFWNGSTWADIATSSLGLTVNTAGDWTGTFDGQEGSYYLNAANLANFGTPFYTFFNATTTDALAEGTTNHYFTDTRADARVAAGTTTIRGMFSAGTGLSYNSGTGAFSLNATGDWTGTFDGQEGSYYLSRANHTGTQLASTISDFAATARGLFSSTATGLTYTSGTGVFSLTSGYTIPLLASTTEWATAFGWGNHATAGYENALTFSYPLLRTLNTISLAFGTTTANSWSQLQQFNGNASTTQLTTTGNTYLATSGGNVGIGTTTSTARLAIDGVSDGGTGFLLRTSYTGGVTNGDVFKIQDSSSRNGVIFGIDDDAGYFKTQYVTGTNYIESSAASGNSLLRVYSSNTSLITVGTNTWKIGTFLGSSNLSFSTSFDTTGSKLTLTSAGNLGIGTTSPFTTLGVGGSAYIGGNLTATGTAAVTGLATFSSGINVNGETITDLTGTGLSNSGGALTVTTSGDWTGTFDGQEGSYYLSRANHTGTQTASTISDFASVARGLLSSTVPGLTYTSGTGVFSLTSGYEIPLTASTTEWATAFSWGNHATAGYENALTFAYPLVRTLNDIALAFGTTTANSWSQLQQFTGNASTTQLTSTGSTYLATSGGNVGIGTTSPSRKLEVADSSTAAFARISNTGAIAGQVAGLELIHTGYGWGTAFRNTLRSGGTASDFSIRQDGVDVVTIRSGGNVGIGTTNPGEKLEIENAGSVNLLLDNTSNSVQLTIGAQASAARITAGSGDALGLGAGGTTDQVYLTTGGNVGIGTSTVAARLHVVTTSGSQGRFAFDLGNYTDVNYDGFNTVGGGQRFRISGTEYMRIDSSGNVGIGTTSPFTTLGVGGSAYIGGNLTATGTAAVTGLATFSSGINVNGETVTDLTGTGLSNSGGALTVTTSGDWTGTFDGQEGSYYLSRANHTGTQTASTISDFVATVAGILAGTTTDTLSEGSTNQYYTDARARSAISSTATGLTYTSGTGVFSLTSGYTIPLTASTTEWATAFTWGNHATAGYENTLTFSYPLVRSVNAISLAFGTTTANSWSQLQQFNGNASTTQLTSTGSTYLATGGGNVGVGTTTVPARLSIDTAGASNVGLSIRGFPSQSQPLQEWRSSDNTLAGRVRLNNTTGGILEMYQSGVLTAALDGSNGRIWVGATGALSGNAPGASSAANFSVLTSANRPGFIIRGASGQAAALTEWQNVAGTALSVVDASGNLGLGTTTPFTKLGVTGDVYIAGNLTATGTASLSGLATFSSGINVNGETITDLTGSGLTNSAGSLTVTTSGDWTGTFDGQEGSYYLSRANHTGTQAASTISDFAAAVGSYISGSTTIPHIGGTAYGDMLSWNGSGWSVRATSTLGIALSDTTGLLGQSQGGTGFASYTAGELLYADLSGNLQTLGIGSAGQVLKVTGGLPSWGADITSGGGGGATAWATTSDSLAIYPSDTSDVLIIGNSSTSTANSILEIFGRSYFSDRLGIGTTSPGATLSVAGTAIINGLTTIFGGVNAPIYTATSTTATSTFPNASVSNLSIGGDFFTDLVGTGLALSGSTLTTTLGTAVDLAAEITGTLGVGNGGTGLASTPTFGQLLVGNGTGYTLTATSSLGLPTFATLADYFTLADWYATTTDGLAEGSTNQYYTDARARSAISSTATGLTYTSGTGVFSLTSGYTIPLTASTTEWATAFSWGNHATAGYENALTFSYPLVRSVNTISLAFGTTTANQWSQLQEFNGNASTTQLTTTGNAYLATAGGNVGIGTTNPGQKLEVSGGSINIATANNYLRVAGNAVIGANGSAHVILGSTGVANDFTFQSSGSTGNVIATFKNSGNVGIGTTSPSGLLSVSGGSAGSVGPNALGNLLVLEDNSSTGISILVPDVSTSRLIFGSPSNNIGSNINWDFADDLFQIQTEGEIVFGTGNNSEKVRINSSGNVGIGTSTPTYALDAYRTDGALLARFRDTDSTYEGIVLSGDTLGGYIGNSRISSSLGESIYFQNSTNAMRFYTGGTEKLRITSGGNVGIGTSSPYAKLSVVGQAVAEFFTGTSTTAVNTLPNALFTNATTTSFAINSETFTDLTGTGLSNVGGTLTVTTSGDWTGTFDGQEGSYYLSRANHTGTQLASTISDFTNAVAGVLAGTTTDALAEGSTNLYFTDGRATSNFISNLAATTSVSSITALPNLGTVATSLSGVLKAASGVLSTGLVNLSSEITGTLGIGNGGTGITSTPSYGQLLVGNGSGYTLTATSSLGLQSVLEGTQGQVAYFSGTNQAVGTSSLFISTNGNVGIGTTTPASKLDVYGDLRVGTRTSGSYRYLDFVAGSASASIQARRADTAAAVDLTIQTSGGNTLLNPTSGNVGIGTTSPISRLHVEGTNAASGGLTISSSAGTATNRLAIFGEGNTSAAIQKLAANSVLSFRNSAGSEEARFGANGYFALGTTTATARLNVQTASTDDILNLFETGGAEVLTVLESGYVGIGTTTPGAMLGVNGNILTSVNDNGGLLIGSVARFGVDNSTQTTLAYRGASGFRLLDTLNGREPVVVELGALSNSLRINASSYVGIGTSTPTNKLHVVASNSTLTYTPQAQVSAVFQRSGDNGISILATDSTQSFINFGDLSSEGIGRITYNHADNSLLLRTNGASTGLLLTSTGNVGVGTSSPYAKLSVVGQTVAEFFTGTSTTAINTFPNALFTNATTTSFGINSETFTDLTGTGLSNVGGALTVTTSGDWTGTFDGQEGSYYLSRANHTGTQLASTISDFSSAVASYINASTTIWNNTTEAGLETFLTDVTNVFTNNDGALSDDDLTNNSIEDLSDVASMTENYGDLLFWNGSAWADIATSSLGLVTNAVTAIGPAGQTADGPTVTLATSTSSFNGLTVSGTLVGSGDTITWTPALSGTLSNAGLANSTVSYGGVTLSLGGTDATPAFNLVDATGLPVSTGISGFGTGVATALGINVGTAGSFVVNGGALGTPSSGTLTNATGLPIVGGTTGTLTVARGGTGTTTAPVGQVLYGGSGGVYQSVATTSITVGSGLSYSGTFGALLGGIAGTLSLDATGNWTGTFDGQEGSYYLANSFSTTSANYWETQQTARTADDLTNNSIEDLSDVASMTETLGDLLSWNGSAWTDVATSTLGFITNAITAIGPAGQTADGPTVTMATSSDTNIGLTITGSGDTLTFTSNWIGTLANSRLTNSTVSYGGVTLSLGGTDATPAFNLVDATGLPVSTGISGFGAGVATALGVNVGTAGSFVVNGGALGTPSSGTLTNATGLPLTTGVTGTLPVGNGGTGATTFTNNRLLTGNGTGALVDEANLTFDGSLLTVTGNASTTQLTTTGSTFLATTAGNLNVGTTTSQNAGIVVDYNTLGKGSGLVIFSATNQAQLSTGRLTLSATYSGTGGGYIENVSGNLNLNSSSGALTFNRGGTEVGRFDSSGRFGVGTSTPTGKLHVYQTAVTSTDGFMLETSGANTARFYLDTNSVLNIQRGTNTGQISLATGGNVGVGTTSPGSKLGVAGGLSVGANYGAAAPTNGAIIEGSVGIGTTSPYAKLSVVGQVVGEYFTATSTLATSTFAGAVSAGNDTVRIYKGGKIDIGSFAMSGNALNVYTSAAGTVANFQSNGMISGGSFVKVDGGNSVTGTVRPFYGSVDSTVGSIISNQQNGNGYAAFEALVLGTGDAKATYSINGGQTWAVGLDNSDSDSFKISGNANLGTSDYLTVTTGGNVGIGTTSPQVKVEISDATNPTLRLTNSTGGNPTNGGTIQFSEGGGAQFSLTHNGSTNTLQFDSATVSGILTMMRDTGNVGVGTTSPYAKLSVVGQAVAEFFTGTSTTAVNTFPNALFTNATSTSLGINSETFTDLTGTGLSNVGGALTVTTSGDWTGTFDGQEGSYYLANSFSTTSANYWETQQTARTADDLTDNSIEDLSDVASMTEILGDLLSWNGSAWTNVATSTLGFITNAITAIGPAGQTADGPTVTMATSTGSFNGLTTGLTITGSGDTLTYTPSISGTLSNAGLANSTVSYGGVTLSLGGSDATPAFNLVDATGLPVSTGISGLGTGVATFLATPSTANLASAVTGETGSGALVFGTSPTLTTPNLGTPSALTLTNATGLPVSTGISGLGTGVATALAVNTGTAGSFVVNGGALGTPSSGTLTNATGLPIVGGTTGTLTVARGGTGTTTAPVGQVLYGGSGGVYQSVATTSVTIGSGLSYSGTLGSVLGGVAGTLSVNTSGDWTGTFDGQEGSYYLARANHTGTQLASTISDFSSAVASYINASTTIWNNTTEAGLETFLTDVTNVFTNNDGALSDDDLTNNSIEDLSDVASMTENYGDLLFWNGSAWADIATSSLGLPTASIVAIGPAGQTADGPTVTFATSTGSFNGLTAGLTITGSGDTLTYTPSISGTLNNAGLTNSSVSFGGVSVSLGGSDVTPAFDLTDATSLPIATGVDGLGSGVATALGINTGSAGAVVLFNGALGTPSSGTLTNATGLPVSTGISGLGTGIATFLATPSTANLASAVTGETGSGALVFGTSPTLTTPNLGTPSAATLTNATGLPLTTGVTGTLAVGNGGTGLASTPTYGQILVGNGTGYTLTATSSLGLVTSAVTAIGPAGQTADGPTVTIATSTSSFNGLTVSGTFVGSGDTITFTPALSGTLSNAGLANSSVSFGGVSVSLGGSDVTPAFDLTDATGLPIATGVDGLGTGVATFLATPSSVNLISAVTDETGSGALVFGTSPTLTTPNLGTPSAVTLTNATGLPVSTGISGLGTGVATALAVNTGTAGSFVVNGGALGTPSSGTLTNATGLPVSTGISGLGSGVATFLATPSTANLAAAVTGETGSGALVFGTSPSLTTPNLGTPSAVTLTNATGLPLTTGVTGTLPVGNGGTGLASTPTYGQILVGNGSGYTLTATSSLGLGTITAVGPTGQQVSSGAVAIATSTSSFNGLTVSGTFVGSGNTITFTPALSGTLANAGLANSTVSYGGVTLSLGGSDATPAFLLTDATGLPVATGISGLGSGVATFLATPSTANLAAAVTGETGSGALVFGTSPTLTTPNLGTPSTLTLTNATGLPISTGVSGLGSGVATFLGTPSSANFAAALTDESGNAGVFPRFSLTSQAFGDVPTWNGSTWVNTATSSLGITASLSGSTGQVAYFSGSNTAVGTSSIFIATSGNVGVGTAGPVGQLHVSTAGTGDDDGQLRVEAADDPSIMLVHTGVHGWGITVDTSDSNNFQIGNSNTGIGSMTDLFTITTGGNVGIGSTTPWQELSVNGDIALAGGNLYNTSEFQFLNGASAQGIKAGSLWISSNFTGTAPTNGAYIEGNVGIGTTTAAQDLVIQGTAGATAGRITFDSGGATNRIFSITSNSVSVTTVGGTASDLVLNGAGGNVGIGTTTPSYKLDVAGNARIGWFANPSLTLTGLKAGGNEWVSQTVDADGRFRIFDTTGARESLTILQTSGNVGIGATSGMSDKLTISGSASALRLIGANADDIATFAIDSNDALIISTTAGAGAQGYIDLRSEDNEYGLILRESDGTGTAAFANLYVTDATSDYLSIGVGAAATSLPFHITAGGSIGVGTTTPFGTFSIEQGTETASLWVGNTGSSTPSFAVSGVNGNGSVSIGTSLLSAYKLNVGGAVRTTDGTVGMAMSPFGAIGYFGTITNHPLGIITNNTEYMRINAAGGGWWDGGNVGIGYSGTPSAALQVTGGGGGAAELLRLSGYELAPESYWLGVTSVIGSGTVDYRMRTQDGVGGLRDVLYFDGSNGFVGVGTTTPTRKFSVTDAVSTAQAIIAYDSTRYVQFLADSVGDLTIDAQGGDISALDENFFLCTGGSCPSGTPSGTGNLIVETSIGIASSTPWAGLSIASGKAIAVAENTLATSTSMTIDWRNGNQQLVRIGTAGTTISFSGFIEGQKLVLTVCNPNATAGAISWGTQILWSGGTAPTQTTTANKCDVWSFLATQATSTMKIFGTQSANF